MNPWRRFRALSPTQRVLVTLALVLPILIALEGVGDGFRMWLMAAGVTLVPLLVVRRMYPPVDGVYVSDPSHPHHDRANRVEIGIVVLVVLLLLVTFSLLG